MTPEKAGACERYAELLHAARSLLAVHGKKSIFVGPEPAPAGADIHAGRRRLS
jgi:hypothetical protein